MSWKRIPAIALLSCSLWLFADRMSRADDVPSWDDQLPSPHHERHDASTYMVRLDEPTEKPQPPEKADDPRPSPRMDNPPPSPPRQEPPHQFRSQPENRYQGRPGAAMMPGDRMPMGGGYYGPGPGMMGPFVPYSPPPQDPEAVKEMQLEEKVQQLANVFRNFDNPQIHPNKDITREDIQKQIEDIVAQQFDLRQERRQKELKRFEEQIKKLRETIEKRQKARNDIIDRHVKELLGQEDDMKF